MTRAFYLCCFAASALLTLYIAWDTWPQAQNLAAVLVCIWFAFTGLLFSTCVIAIVLDAIRHGWKI